MKKKDLKNKKFVYCWDNIKLVCEANGCFDGMTYYLCYPDDPEFIIVKLPAKFCGNNDFGTEDWEIEGERHAFVEYIDGTGRFLRTSSEIPGVIMEEDTCHEVYELYEK